MYNYLTRTRNRLAVSYWLWILHSALCICTLDSEF